MRQVDRDRVARIDAEVARYQELFKVRFAKESATDFKREAFDAHLNTNAIQRKIQELLDRRERLLNRAIFGSMKKSEYERKIEERQFNYENALEEQQYYIDTIAEAMSRNDSDEIAGLRRKLSESNRLTAIYKRSLEFLKKRESTVKNVREFKELDSVTQNEIRTINQPDAQILEILRNQNKKSGTTGDFSILDRPDDIGVVGNKTLYSGTGKVVIEDSGKEEEKQKGE